MGWFSWKDCHLLHPYPLEGVLQTQHLMDAHEGKNLGKFLPILTQPPSFAADQGEIIRPTRKGGRGREP